MSLKPSRKLTPEEREKRQKPKTKTLRVIVEVEIADPYTEAHITHAIARTLRLSRPNEIRNFRVVGYSKVQSGETRKLRNAVRKAGAEEPEALVIKQSGRKN